MGMGRTLVGRVHPTRENGQEGLGPRAAFTPSSADRGPSAAGPVITSVKGVLRTYIANFGPLKSTKGF